jgi:two-component system cell cycle response regulator
MSQDKADRSGGPAGGVDPTIRIDRAPAELLRETVTKAYLTVIRGSDHDLGRYVVIERQVSLGRGTGCDLQLRDQGVSREHARIERDDDGECTLFDLGSMNGTDVGARKVTEPWVLADGDKIFLGDTVLRFAFADDLDLGFQTEVAQIVGEDPLTGLESKRRFDDALAFAFESSRRAGAPLCLMMMDMDGVKTINDTHGHLFGAHVIGETGRIIAGHLRAVDHACRFGGDEFCAFLPGLGRDEAVEVAEAIRKAVESAQMEKDGIALAPTLSIGVASRSTEADPLDLLAKADAALYRAKAAGKNRTA